MERRDYLLKQLEQMLKVIQILIGKLLGMKPEELPSVINFIHDSMQDHFKIDFEEMLDVPATELPQFLLQAKVQAELFDSIAELLYRLAEIKLESDNDSAKKYLQQALALYDYLDNESGLLSFNRPSLRKKTEQLLKLLS